MNNFTYKDFMKRTVCTFKACKVPKRNPNYISPSGSKYWYGEDKYGKFVIRYSDHWTYFSNTQWGTNGLERIKSISGNHWGLFGKRKSKCGKAYLANFHRDYYDLKFFSA